MPCPHVATDSHDSTQYFLNPASEMMGAHFEPGAHSSSLMQPSQTHPPAIQVQLCSSYPGRPFAQSAAELHLGLQKGVGDSGRPDVALSPVVVEASLVLVLVDSLPVLVETSLVLVMVPPVLVDPPAEVPSVLGCVLDVTVVVGAVPVRSDVEPRVVVGVAVELREVLPPVEPGAAGHAAARTHSETEIRENAEVYVGTLDMRGLYDAETRFDSP